MGSLWMANRARLSVGPMMVELRRLSWTLRIWGTRKGLGEKTEVCMLDRPFGFSVEKRSKELLGLGRRLSGEAQAAPGGDLCVEVD